MSSSRQKKKEITRQKLIEAAIAEFAEVGYARANVSRISKRAGYASGTIYYYFRSKHDLLIALVERSPQPSAEEKASTTASTRASLSSRVEPRSSKRFQPGWATWARPGPRSISTTRLATSGSVR